MMMGNRYQEGMVTLLPDSPSARLPPQHSSASPSFSSPASHSHSVPCPGLWGDAEGTGSGLALRVSREHKVGQRQKRFLGSPQKTRCDEAAVNTSDLNSPATGMKLRMPQGSETYRHLRTGSSIRRKENYGTGLTGMSRLKWIMLLIAGIKTAKPWNILSVTPASLCFWGNYFQSYSKRLKTRKAFYE